MLKQTPAQPAAHRVWRITAETPQGEYVQLEGGARTVAAVKAAAASPAGDSSCWLSSVELEKGASVTEYVWDCDPPEVLALVRRN